MRLRNRSTSKKEKNAARAAKAAATRTRNKINIRNSIILRARRERRRASAEKKKAEAYKALKEHIISEYLRIKNYNETIRLVNDRRFSTLSDDEFRVRGLLNAFAPSEKFPKRPLYAFVSKDERCINILDECTRINHANWTKILEQWEPMRVAFDDAGEYIPGEAI